MKRYLYIILCAALLTSCAKDVLIDQGTLSDGESINATFTLAPDFVEEIEVRSVAGVDEKVIKDLWVIQLDAGGTIQLQAPKYIETGLTASASDCKVSVSLKREASKIYFIANTHNAALYTTAMKTSADVEAVAMTLTGEANLASANGIPMSGVWTGTPDLLGIAGRVSLSRAIAKVNFNLNTLLPTGEIFVLKSVTMKQIPNMLNYYRDDTSLNIYPYPATPTVINYPAMAYDEILTNSSKTLGWYLPENARGIGTATTQTDKAVKIPTGQTNYCTYIEVSGQYILSPGIAYAATYRIYLGANNTTDYNIKRNTVYNVNTTIRGIDAADTRINTKEVTLDYTDNGKGWFLVAPVDAKNPSNGTSIMNWYLATGTYDAISNPLPLGSVYFAEYKVPDPSQLLFLWIYKDAIENNNFTTDVDKIYWSENTSPANSTDAICIRLSNGHIYSGGKVSSNVYVRYIKEIKDHKYPYVVNGNTIVSRDEEGGVKSRAIHPNWSTLPEHVAGSSDNKVSAKLEVAFSDAKNPSDVNKTTMNGYLAIGINHPTYNPSNLNACPDGWRLPTQRELELIYVLHKRGDLNSIASMNYEYWSGTFAALYSTACHMNFTYGVTATPSITMEYRVRCVRDVNS